MNGTTTRGRIRVYAVGIAVLSAGIVAAVAVRSDVEAAAPQDVPAVTAGQESIHVVEEGSPGGAPAPAHDLTSEPAAGDVSAAVWILAVQVSDAARPVERLS
jgi:hypothetical protein